MKNNWIKFTGLVVRTFLVGCIMLNCLIPIAWAAEVPGAVEATSTLEAGPATDKAVVFLLDASNSMNTYDKDRLAIDSMAQLIYSLPTDYLSGVVVYNSRVVYASELVESSKRQQVMEGAAAIRYAGYTNGGAGLARAIELLSGGQYQEKTIVILSDGEIDMGSSRETANSLAQFEAATDLAAAQNIRIHVIGLGPEMAAPQTNIFPAAENTDGTKIQIARAEDVADAIETILVEQLGLKKNTGGFINASGGTDQLTVALPMQHMSKVRILLTSTGPIQNLITDFQASEAKQLTGPHYALIEIKNPTMESVNIQVQARAGSQIKVDVLPEYALTATTTLAAVEYPEPEKGDEPVQQQSYTIRFYDTENPAQQVLTDSLFDNLTVPLQVGGESFAPVLEAGELTFTLTVAEDQELPLEFDFSRLPVNVISQGAVLAAPLQEWPDTGLSTLAKVAIGLGAAAVAVTAYLLLRRRPPILSKPPEPEPSKYSYTGRLSLFITRTPSRADVPPLSFNLFRQSTSREISLGQILEGCGVTEIFPGADGILFQPGAERSLILTNKSDCTIMRNREILMKGKSYQLPLDAKVDITFEDERSELAFQYKPLKPSLMGA